MRTGPHAGVHVEGNGEGLTFAFDREHNRALVRFPAFVTPAMAAEATRLCVDAARRCEGMIDVVADLLDVQGFSPEAAIAAIRRMPPGQRLVRVIELVVDNKIVRVAAISAAHLVGIPCTVRAHR